MKKIIYISFGIGIIVIISLGGYFYPKTDLWLGAPTQTFQSNLFPLFTNQYLLGSSTRQWLSVSSQNASSTISSATTLCLTGDTCRTTWPTGAAQTPWTSNIDGGGFSLSNVLKGTITNASTTYLTVANNTWIKNDLQVGGNFNMENNLGIVSTSGLVFYTDNTFTTDTASLYSTEANKIILAPETAGGYSNAILGFNFLSGDRTFTFPNLSGTFLIGSGTSSISNLTITNASTTYLTVSGTEWIDTIQTTNLITTTSNQMWNGGSYDFYSDGGITNVGGLVFNLNGNPDESLYITTTNQQFSLNANLLTGIRNLYIPDITGTFLMATGTQAFILGQGQVKAGSNATTSFEIGQAGQNKGTCIVVYDVTGAVEYIRFQGESLVISNVSCK